MRSFQWALPPPRELRFMHVGREQTRTRVPGDVLAAVSLVVAKAPPIDLYNYSWETKWPQLTCQVRTTEGKRPVFWSLTSEVIAKLALNYSSRLYRGCKYLPATVNCSIQENMSHWFAFPRKSLYQHPLRKELSLKSGFGRGIRD